MVRGIGEVWMQALQSPRTRLQVLSIVLPMLLVGLASCGRETSPTPSTTPQAPNASTDAPEGEPAEAASPAQRNRDSIVTLNPQGFAVSGAVAVGGHEWEIPETVFAADTVAGRPSLRWCTAVGLADDGSMVRDGMPYLSLLFGSQESPDQSAGDYVSGSFDGVTLTGGAYDHGTGEEWAWSVTDVRVRFGPGDSPVLAVEVSWSGDAGENFSARRDSVEGSVTCVLVSAGTMESCLSDENRCGLGTSSDPQKQTSVPAA